jgi:hypothetical protein
MKTNVTLSSESRNLFGVIVRQQTKTGFLSLSDLQAAYNLGAEQHGWSEKRADNFFKSVENCERAYELLFEMKKVNVQIYTFTQNLQKNPVKYLKSLGVWKTSRKEGVSVDPYVWVSIAMWMNPKIYAKTVIWLTDKLLVNRIEAGNLYKDLAKAVARYPDVDYQQLAKGLNHITFGRHESGIRNSATQQQLDELRSLESNLAFAVDMGLIPTYAALIAKMLDMYYAKYPQARLVN